MTQVEQPLELYEFLSVDLNNESFVQFGAMFAEKTSTFNLAIGDTVHDGQNVFALGVRVSFDAFIVVPACARHLFIREDHTVQDLALL